MWQAPGTGIPVPGALPNAVGPQWLLMRLEHLLENREAALQFFLRRD